MSPIVDAILYVWNFNLDYINRLLKDVPQEKMAANPSALPQGTILNHPAWVLSHLSAYHPATVSIITGTSLTDDPVNHPFGMKSKPVLETSVYLPKAELLEKFVAGHSQIEKALKEALPERFEAAPSLERWRQRFKNNAQLLCYLTCYHESTHLGQISVWRRVQGMAAV